MSSFSSQLTIGSLWSISRPEWFLRFMTILLYSDLHFLALYNISLFKFPVAEWLKIFQTKDILLFIICITFLLSSGLGTLRSLMEWLWRRLFEPSWESMIKWLKDRVRTLIPFLSGKGKSSEDRSVHLKAYRLHQQAIEEKNNFDLMLYKEHMANIRKNRPIKDICFGFIVLCFLDSIIYPLNNDTLVVFLFKSYFNLNIYLKSLIGLPFILLIIGAIVIAFDFSSFNEANIYYPQKSQKD